MNIGLNLIVQLVIKFIAVLLAVFTTRWLVSNVNSADFAQYNVGLAFVSVIISIVHGGIPNVIQKYYTNDFGKNLNEKEKVDRFWSTFALIRLITYFVGLVLILLSYRLSGVENLGLLCSIYTILWLLIADLGYRSVCDAMAKTWQFNLTDVFARALILIGLLSYSFLKIPVQSPLSYFILISGIAYFCGLLADSIWQRKYTTWAKPDFRIFTKHLKSITYLWVSAITVALFMTTDKLFLRYFGYSDGVINGYSNAYKVFETAGIIPGIAMPTVASLLKKRLDSNHLTKISSVIKNLLSINSKLAILLEWVLYTFVVGFVCFGLVFVISPLFINIIDVNLKYPLALQVLPLLIIPVFLLFFIQLFMLLNIFMNGEKYELYGTTIILIVTVTLYLILIPKFGIMGAGLATLGGYICDLLVKIFFFSKSFIKYTKTDLTVKDM